VKKKKTNLKLLPGFRETVCTTVPLSYQTVVCPVCMYVCLSVTLVYSGQTVGWIKMKLGMQLRLALATLC